MRGLLIKDYKLMKNQKNFLMIIVSIGILMAFTNTSPLTGVSYILYLITFSSLTNLSYDEADNCMMFLMTLPTGRKQYVKEKYIFGLINSFSAWIILSLALSAFELFRGSSIMAISELCMVSFVILLVSLIFFAIYLPIQLKFGSEKSRIALLILCGGVFAASFILANFKIADRFPGAKNFFMEMSNMTITILAICISVLCMTISYLLSKKIIMEKEF